MISLLLLTSIIGLGYYDTNNNYDLCLGLSGNSKILIDENTDSFELVYQFELNFSGDIYYSALTSFIVPHNIKEYEYISCDLYYITIENNYFYAEMDFIADNERGDLGYTASGIISINLYEDYVLEDFNFPSQNLMIYNGHIYENGYNTGFEEGYENAEYEFNGVNNVISWFGSIWDGLSKILALEIAPNLTIGTIITIPIVIAVLFFGLKALIQ